MTRVKVAISLPPELLEALDRARRADGATRSEYLRRAVRAHLEAAGRGEVATYVQAYEAQPESEDEISAARAGAVAVLAAEPWE